MKLFKKLKSRKRTTQENPVLQIENVETDHISMDQIEEFVKECCEQMLEASDEVEKIKKEYQLVISYLHDIQEIKQLPLEIQTEIRENSRAIQKINQERKVFQSKEVHISDSLYLHIRQYEEEIPKTIEELKEKENYRSKVKRDLEYLEGEKGAINYHRKELLQSQQNMKGIAIISFVTMIIILSFLIVAHVSYEMNAQLGYLITIFAAGVITISIFLKIRYNTYELKKSERGINKTIQYLNKTKIKYVNITNEIDYLYEKYRVNSSHELIYLWEQFRKAKNDRAHYKLTSKDLEFYLEELSKILKNFNIKDSSVWLNQPEVFVDDETMEDIAAGLMKRRQSLRERIEYNTELAEKAKKRISDLIERDKKNAKAILDMVNSVVTVKGL